MSEFEAQVARVIRNGKTLTSVIIQPMSPPSRFSPFGVYRASDNELLATGATELVAKIMGEMYLKGYAAGYDEGHDDGYNERDEEAYFEERYSTTDLPG
jgi:hypothetical protein